MKNKKAQITEATIMIIALLIGSQAIYSSYLHQASVAKAVLAPTESIDFFASLDKMDIFNRESGKLAISQAYADAISQPADCKIVFSMNKSAAIWNETCRPDNKRVKEDFSKELSAGFAKISGKEKFKINVREKDILFTPSDITGKLPVTTEFLKYEVSHSLYQEFSLNYSSLDLESIHATVMSRKKSCTSNNTISESCMKPLKIAGWTTSIESGDYLVFTLKSDESYFYDSSFKPAEIRFALQKLS